MKSFRILALFALTLVLTPALFASDFGIRAGRFSDSDEEFVGVDVLYNLGALNLNPNIEYSLEDDVTAGTANIDVTFDLINVARLRPYVGAGVGLAYRDDVTANTNVVGNLIGGFSFDLASLKPYAQVKYVRLLDDDDNGAGDDEDDIAFTIGLRF